MPVSAPPGSPPQALAGAAAAVTASGTGDTYDKSMTRTSAAAAIFVELHNGCDAAARPPCTPEPAYKNLITNAEENQCQQGTPLDVASQNAADKELEPPDPHQILQYSEFRNLRLSKQAEMFPTLSLSEDTAPLTWPAPLRRWPLLRTERHASPMAAPLCAGLAAAAPTNRGRSACARAAIYRAAARAPQPALAAHAHPLAAVPRHRPSRPPGVSLDLLSCPATQFVERWSFSFLRQCQVQALMNPGPQLLPFVLRDGGNIVSGFPLSDILQTVHK
ncbi:hypothetical protein CB1_001751002 [Camelus ferus]|nr:hypothetical protein CB1_001751002 [Camelus ferus]